MSFSVDNLGFGVGLRTQHYNEFTTTDVPCQWCEAISENFLVDGGQPLAVLEKVRRDRPVVLHGVSLSIGATDSLNHAYLTQLRALAKRIEPAWVSDHLCWGSQGGHYAHDLLPMPYTEEAVQHVVSRVLQVQEVLGRQIMLENVSSYIEFEASTMTEWEFLSAISTQADCGILLDVNNIYVSAHNHGYNAEAFIAGIPTDRVGQFHLAGHQTHPTHLLDTHDGPVCDAVWQLYKSAVKRFGATSTLVEWDDKIPDLQTVLAQAEKAAQLTYELGALPPRAT